MSLENVDRYLVCGASDWDVLRYLSDSECVDECNKALHPQPNNVSLDMDDACMRLSLLTRSCLSLLLMGDQKDSFADPKHKRLQLNNPKGHELLRNVTYSNIMHDMKMLFKGVGVMTINWDRRTVKSREHPEFDKMVESILTYQNPRRKIESLKGLVEDLEDNNLLLNHASKIFEERVFVVAVEMIRTKITEVGEKLCELLNIFPDELDFVEMSLHRYAILYHSDDETCRLKALEFGEKQSLYNCVSDLVSLRKDYISLIQRLPPQRKEYVKLLSTLQSVFGEPAE